MIPLDQRSTLFPYTTLFRSRGAGAGGRGPRAFRDGRRGEPRGGEGAGRSAVRGAAGVWKRDAGKGNEPRDVALPLGGRFFPRCALRVANTRKVSRLRGGCGADQIGRASCRER